MTYENGWPEYKRLFLDALERLKAIEEKVEILDRRIVELHTSLRLKSGIWGVVGASLAAISVILAQIAGRLFH